STGRGPVEQDRGLDLHTRMVGPAGERRRRGTFHRTTFPAVRARTGRCRPGMWDRFDGPMAVPAAARATTLDPVRPRPGTAGSGCADPTGGHGGNTKVRDRSPTCQGP